MKKTMISLAVFVFVLGGCAPDRPPAGDEGEPETLQQHPAWASREADFFLEDGVWKLKASGMHISESWKAFSETLPSDRDWSVAVDVTVPRFWDTIGTEEAQVGAGVFVGKLDPDGKSRTVYETNLAAILFFMDGILVDVKHIDHKGIDDWDMAENRFMAGVMGFAENTDITGHFPFIDNFTIKITD